MPQIVPAPDARVVVRPRSTLVQRLTLSVVAATTPLFLALYVLGIPRGSGWLILGLHLLIALGFILVLLRRRRLVVWTTETAMVRVGVFAGPRTVPRTSIDSIVLAETYRTNAPDTATQLFVQDAEGRRLARLDGVFWSTSSIATLVAALEKSVTVVDEPMTTREFFRRYPGSAFWFQRRGLPTIAVIVTLVAFTGLVLATMSLAGIPTMTPF